MRTVSTAPSSKRPFWLGVGFALLAAVGFSAKAILVKLAYQEHVNAITLLSLRMAFSVPAFIAVALWSNRTQGLAPLSRRDWFAVFGLGLVGYYLASYLDFVGLQYISAGLERLTLFLYPTLVVLLSAWWFRHAIGRRELAALALSYAGIALVVVHDAALLHGHIALGMTLVFGSALAYAIYLIGAGRVMARIGTMRFTAYALTVSCLASLLQFGLTQPLSALHLSGRVYGFSLGMALFSTVLPAFLLSAAMRRIGAKHTALIGAIGPVATIYLAYVFLGEAISPLQITGSVLVLCGVMMVSLGKRTPA